MKISDDDPHEVAKSRAELAMKAMAEAERATKEERLFLRAAAAMQAMAAFAAESAGTPGNRLQPAMERSVAQASQTDTMDTELFGGADLPTTQRALTAAFHALKEEAANSRVDLSGVIRAALGEA